MDPLALMFAQIQNAQNAGKEHLTIPFSKMKMAILTILKEHHEIADFNLKEIKKFTKNDKEKNSTFTKIEIKLKENSQNLLDFCRLSRPGRRLYASASEIPHRKRPQSLVIVSTSCGVLEGEAARKKGLGGELIVEVR